MLAPPCSFKHDARSVARMVQGFGLITLLANIYSEVLVPPTGAGNITRDVLPGSDLPPHRTQWAPGPQALLLQSPLWLLLLCATIIIIIMTTECSESLATCLEPVSPFPAYLAPQTNILVLCMERISIAGGFRAKQVSRRK